MPAGQPTKYRKRYCKDAAKLCTLGATDKDLAEFFDVSESTVKLWRETHPEFSATIKEAKEQMDAKIEKALAHRALGYSHPDTHFSQFEGSVIETPTTKHYPPSEVACIFWLKNRQPGKWRDKQDVDLNVTSPIEAIADALARRKAAGVSE